MDIYVGTSGYTYRDWRKRFYPIGLNQKNWLEYYASQFSTVEINATFYRSFEKRHYQNWHRKTPNHFQFVIKGPRFITHQKKLSEIEDSVAFFFDSLSELGKKLKGVIWQFPATFKQTEENREKLVYFFNLLPQEVFQAIELRDSSWFNEEGYTLLSKSHITFVNSDTPEFPISFAVTSPICYIRFHGPGKLYASKYSDEELSSWVKKIKSLNVGKTYCFFNNDFSAYAIENARKFEELVNQL